MLVALFGHPKDSVSRGLNGHATLSCLSQPLGSLQGQGWLAFFDGGLVAASLQFVPPWSHYFLIMSNLSCVLLIKAFVIGFSDHPNNPE